MIARRSIFSRITVEMIEVAGFFTCVGIALMGIVFLLAGVK